MTSTTVHRTAKQKWLLCIIIGTACLLFMITPLMGPFKHTTAYGAGLQVTPTQTGLSKGINMMINVKKATTQSSRVNLVVFFTRPLACTQDPANCGGNIKLYAPDTNVSCSSPIPQSQKSSAANPAWVSHGEECPYLNCNWTSAPGGCSAQTNNTLFHSLTSPIAGLGNVYMNQPLDFKDQPLNNARYGFSGCIYYANWPEFPTQNLQFLVFGSDIQLVSGTLPTGVTLQTIQQILATPSNETTITGSWLKGSKITK